MEKLMIFTDGSVNPRSKIGYGAYLAVPEGELLLALPETRVLVRRFELTTSTKLELQTVLWALNDVDVSRRKVTVVTDSQNIVGLRKRRDRFEKNAYRSRNHTRLKNYKLYQAFFTMTDRLDCDVIKVSGHKVSKQKDAIDRFFTLVDRAARRALRGDGP